MATQQYSAGAFQWITAEKTAIQNVAQALGISATAIAGAMAKERTLYELSPTVNYLQDAVIRTMTDTEVRLDYAAVNALGISDTLRHGTGYLDANGFVHFNPEANYAGTDAGFDYSARSANDGEWRVAA